METPPKFKVETENNGWSFIVGPDGYREGPIRYQWEAQEWADEMNAGKPPPANMSKCLASMTVTEKGKSRNE